MVFIRFILAKLTFEPQISFILEKAISRSPDSALLTIIGICTYNSAGTKAHVYQSSLKIPSLNHQLPVIWLVFDKLETYKGQRH